jgi:YbgC/YbaW family acyl-CoA thioester hydrolase
MSAESLELTVPQMATDRYGHVNYRKYLDLFRRGQNAFAKKRSISFKAIEHRLSLRSVVRAIKVEYHRQLAAGEIVVIDTSVQVGTTSFTYSQTIKRNSDVVAECVITVVMVDETGRSCQIPDEIRQKLSQ